MFIKIMTIDKGNPYLKLVIMMKMQQLLRGTYTIVSIQEGPVDYLQNIVCPQLTETATHENPKREQSGQMMIKPYQRNSCTNTNNQSSKSQIFQNPSHAQSTLIPYHSPPEETLCFVFIFLTWIPTFVRFSYGFLIYSEISKMKNILDQLNSRLIQTQTKISNSSKLNVI